MMPNLLHHQGRVKTNSIFLFLTLFLFIGFSGIIPANAAETDFKGELEIVPGVKNTHVPGKVKMTVFMDFFCPHCHHFDVTELPILKAKYKNKLDVEYKGIPIVDKFSYIPIEAYEAAIDEGKGERMRELLFDTIHYDHKNPANMDVLKNIAKQSGLDPDKLIKRVEGRDKKNVTVDNIALAKKYNVKGTPTIILDGNIKVLESNQKNIETIINSIFANEAK